MGFIAESLRKAIVLIFSGSPDVVSAVWTSLVVAAISTLLASLLGIPAGICIGAGEFPLKRMSLVLLNTLMAMPTVAAGLLVYGLIGRRGVLGSWNLLFTPAGMIVGLTLLAIPIVANYSLSSVKGADPRIVPTALTLGASLIQSRVQLMREVRFGILAAIVAGFGRVISEVGVAMMLGGNIRGYTRTMTTAIALETNKGEFAYGLALGIILMGVALAVNGLLTFLQEKRRS
ncbi:ABC transporter permease [Edaphobacter aggregans]|uniref:ABC transporter permease n=1 Tax=Edaphobacter aggregans TaxID=570835 RepID=UPI000555A640|nr:ABC transporter permease [Edaphobacter aggregans]